MKKDAYYFPHFSNARNDAKIIKLRRIFGIEGYGIYFMLLEALREQTDYKLPLNAVEDLSYDWHVSKEKIISIINDFELFQITDNKFFSPKLVLYLQPYIEKSLRARKAANKRWNNANALQMDNKSNASKVKETKLKETKLNKTKENSISDRQPIDFLIFENYKWFENIIQFLQFKITQDELKQYWNQYKQAMIADDNLYRDAKEYRTHFRNWVKIQVDKKGSNDGGLMKFKGLLKDI